MAGREVDEVKHYNVTIFIREVGRRAGMMACLKAV
jgi:hypothetical protein